MRTFQRRSAQLVSTADEDHSRPDGAADADVPRQGRGAELMAQLRRRHQAALRMSPLEHSGQRDPLSPRERTDGWPR
jgi:hypothetical protein